jgi:SAM-dependent methyltransferase
MVNTALRRPQADHPQTGASVPEPGAAAVKLLNPRPGELILDVGCGDGALTARIAEAGARAIGLDSSPEMVEAARARGVDAFLAEGEALDLEAQVARFGHFDAVFSNAALHWMLDPDAVASGVFAVLKEGGRFAGEMAGAGNLAILRAAIRDEFSERGYKLPDEDSSWYPTIEEFTRLYCVAGFGDVQAHRIDRPTKLPAGVQNWVKTFRAGLFDLAMVPEWERDAAAAAIEERAAPDLRKADGTFFADYVGLRFSMTKPG